MPVMTRTQRALDVFATVALIMSAAAVSWSLLIRPWLGSDARSQVERLKGVSLAGSLLANATGSGPVAIVEFSDFQCPYCGTYARESWPSVKRDLVDAGRVRYVSMHFPLEQIHPLANGAAEAAECAARAGRFWEMHDRLFHAANALSRADLVQHAQVVGVDRARFEACIERGEGRDKIRADQAEGRRLGVSGTPTFFVGTVRADGGVDLLERIRGIVTPGLVEKEVAKITTTARQAAVSVYGLPGGRTSATD